MDKKYRDMTETEKKAFDAAYNGFYLGGNYEVSFKGHTRTFFADSIRWLARDIHTWFSQHTTNHADDQILARYVTPAV